LVFPLPGEQASRSLFRQLADISALLVAMNFRDRRGSINDGAISWRFLGENEVIPMV